MFQKLKEKIRKWLLEILHPDIDALKNEINESTTALRFATNNCNEAARQCQISIQQNEEMKKMYNQITDVAVDVGFHDSERSWAVVCVEGRPEYVKFIPLSGADARTIMNFLRQFQYSRLIVDSPLKFKDELQRYFI
nr:MAG TPA: hypothetical protein [Caudoviricetes sp.]